MKLYFRISIYIISCFLILFFILLITGITSLLMVDTAPLLSSLTKKQHDQLFMILFTISFLFFVIGYIWYLGKPLVYLLLWIRNLANDQYEYPKVSKKSLYNSDGKLKRHFRLYHDVFTQMEQLMNRLKENHIAREQLDQLKQNWGAGISHDLKTPLTYITSYSEMLMSSQYQWSDQEQEDFIKRIHEKANMLEELLQDLNLSFQMEEEKFPIHLKKTDIVEFIRQIVVDIANHPQSSEAQLTFDTTAEPIEINFDPKLLKRSIYNLIMNAVIHNPPDTQIHVMVDLNKSVNISIRDNGIGMDQKTLQNLFKKWQSAGSISKSNGLGAVIAKQLILAHQGTINVESFKNVGTICSITLPKNL